MGQYVQGASIAASRICIYGTIVAAGSPTHGWPASARRCGSELARPGVGREHVVEMQDRPSPLCAESVASTTLRDVREADAAAHELLDGDLVGGGEHGRIRAALRAGLEREAEAGVAREVGRLEVQRLARAPGSAAARASHGDALRV